MDAFKKISWSRSAGHASLITLGFLIAFGLLGLIGPVRFGGDTPAWVQAVGSIFAIFVAVAVPTWQRSQETRDRRTHELLVGRSFGLVLIRELEKMESRIDREITDVLRSANEDLISVEKDTIPQGLWDKGDSLHLLGPAGGLAISAIHAVQRARAEMTGHWLYPENLPAFVLCMKEAKGFCQAAIFHVKIGL